MGYPYQTKLLCRQFSINPKSSEADLLAYIESKFPKNLYNDISAKETNIILDNTLDITHNFTLLEQEILLALIERKFKGTIVLTKDDLSKIIWQDNYFEMYSDQTIDKYISNIRKKLKKLRYSGNIISKKGFGYLLVSAPNNTSTNV